ncbi:thiamine pyrophosphate-dependent enzyme [Herbaspirillum autotrophicum]|uniref:thiamine pyrophosphate-dependent enzyme n=1 Tax=Herbaspirillum autotrophicum TaxID=180195 RepID=UPI00067E3792|nr:thiamine pyrophosphate-dependent enzyme [Herbaspirillum autotrophicum]
MNLTTSSHALLSVFAANQIDRVFLVPGESYLGILDALSDFPAIDVVTCRHEAGAGFMACADGRLTRRPGVVMVSRGPGATNAAIAVHTAQQDAVPLILIVGQVPKADLRKEAFQEIDYQQMYGSIAKWVVEVTAPEQIATAALKAIRIATSGTPGPVVMVIPEDVQQQTVATPHWQAVAQASTQPCAETTNHIARLLSNAERPLIIAGGAFAANGGRAALLALAEKYQVPVAVSFRQHDIFPNNHPLYAGELGLANPAEQIALFDSCDLLLALGTRLGDITTQGYRFPRLPDPAQTLVHVWPDPHIVGLHFSPDIGAVCDPVALSMALLVNTEAIRPRPEWAAAVNGIATRLATWPEHDVSDGVAFSSVVRALAQRAPADVAICLDAGTFAAPVYRHFPFTFPQRLMAPLSGAMGYGTPAAIATQLRRPQQKTVCMTGDGGFLMTGNEINAAVERNLPILFIVSNNNCYGSIRIHQERSYPGRHVGTTLSNPDFVKIAQAFGITAERISRADQIDAAIERGLAAQQPYFIEVTTSLAAVLPKTSTARPTAARSGD